MSGCRLTLCTATSPLASRTCVCVWIFTLYHNGRVLDQRFDMLTIAVLQKWNPYSPMIRRRQQRRYSISDRPRDMSDGVAAHWRSCLTVTVLCRSTWMTWRRRTSASSCASTSWRRGYSRSMRRAAKTCTARWVTHPSGVAWACLAESEALAWLSSPPRLLEASVCLLTQLSWDDGMGRVFVLTSNCCVHSGPEH